MHRHRGIRAHLMMTNNFTILHIAEYLKQMGLKFSQIDNNLNTLELSFHGEAGEWYMIVGIHQSGNANKLMLIVPHVATLTDQRRQDCMEALLAINYRIAIGKFGLDLNDGEVRLEESIPLAEQSISFEQFRLAFSALLQTVSIYRNLIPCLVSSDLTTQQALQQCETDFFANAPQEEQLQNAQTDMTTASEAGTDPSESAETTSDLDVNDVLAEVARLLGKNQN